MDSKEKRKKANLITALAATQITGGSLVIVLFGLINLITGGLACIISAGANSAGFPWIFLIGAVTGGFVIWRGILNLRLAGNFKKVEKVVGDNPSISLINLEKRLYWSRKKVLKTLNKQKDNGFWPGSYIDMTSELFIVEFSHVLEKVTSGNQTVDEQLDMTGALIHDLALTARQIDNPELRAQVEKLADIGRQIYTHVAQHPEKAGMVRRMSNYFLPTTVGLLVKYIEFQQQTVKTEQMEEALQKIGEVMNTLEEVYAKHLDALYKEKALDVEVEVEVLQSMADNS